MCTQIPILSQGGTGNYFGKLREAALRLVAAVDLAGVQAPPDPVSATHLGSRVLRVCVCEWGVRGTRTL